MDDFLKRYFKKKDLDIRKKRAGYSRFMDQKVTPDVLRFVAESIIHHANSNHGPFTVSEIEHSDFFVKNVPREFNKPTPKDERTKHEYDKWPAQIIQALRFAEVLTEVGKKGRAIAFDIAEPKILEYIAARPQNAYTFLVHYITKLLKDSGFYKYFEKYRDQYIAGTLDKTGFYEFKENFIKFIFAYTNIKEEFEPRRIFPKVFNILASEHRLPGTIGGFMSQFPFLASDLIYNRVNFRDQYKSKYISRQEFEELRREMGARRNSDYRVAKAKEHIKKIHAKSEVNDQWSKGEATQVHHIFPDNEFPQLADRLENLILLTGTQHNTKAHPDNNNSIIDRDYQLVCLIEKLHTVEQSLAQGQYGYSKESFIGVINAGLGLAIPYDADFKEIEKQLKRHYAS